jgi:DNA polymerase elongation subunit (family B)
MQTTGWLFDLYPLDDRVVLWFITADAERLRVEDDFPYCVYLGGPQSRLRTLAQAAGQYGWLSRSYPARGRDLWSGRELPVLALELKSYSFLPRLRHWLGRLPADISCYNCDLDVAAYYLYQRRLWPCLWYGLEVQAGRLQAISPQEDAFALEFSLPPLHTLTLGLTRDHLIPLDRGNGVVIGWEGRTMEFEAHTPAGLLQELGHCLTRVNPDLVLSDWGDEEILPTLVRWSRQYRVPLPLDREAHPAPRNFASGRSYFSYGQIIYQGSSVPLYGRWHVDRRNSFYFRETGLAGLAQTARIGQMPLQQVARASPGTLITSMQLARAVADGILIPWRKGEPERFKSAAELLIIDKGGLTFMPPVGLQVNVAEVDFASMYPTIMAVHNISPETVNCACCAEAVISGQCSVVGASERQDFAGERLAETGGGAGASTCGSPAAGLRRSGLTPPPVPEAGYHLCHRREGLVPRTLKPILTLREALKARAKEVGLEAARPYKERQTALKWMLVTCFGYLGYKNARFGRIEAHEAVTAYGRDKLLRAKEIFEAAGFEILHGLTDCLWVRKPRRDLSPPPKFPSGYAPATQRGERTGAAIRRGGPACPPSGGHPYTALSETPGLEPPLPPAGEGCGEGGWSAPTFQAEVEELCREVSAATGVKLALEGIYRWLCFMASKQDPRRPVATRYFGVFEDGSLKVRGLALRRRDTPPFVRRAQEALLAKMAEAATLQELAALKPELEEMAAGFRQQLREGSVTAADLVITRVLSQPMDEYKVDTPTVLAARQLARAGIHLDPGQKVRYVHREPKRGPKECRVLAAPFLDTLDDYDAGFYLDLLERALAEVMFPLADKICTTALL